MTKTTNKIRCASPYETKTETDMYLGVHQNLNGTKVDDFLS